ncbi:histone-lysine N-methyltransferase ASHH2 isoform X2 [Syzygium oleosum]|uniref:histone-lysine N-methyltransferase ASHH2 isoform X2 n=1 Tax=Syzygium oleosum TaxID=219896 RepID=UPI0024B984A7|nr:histone-lysine N-methyltransferase ASHH2 isoform X2 [Syzygium oleosum]
MKLSEVRAGGSSGGVMEEANRDCADSANCLIAGKDADAVGAGDGLAGVETEPGGGLLVSQGGGSGVGSFHEAITTGCSYVEDGEVDGDNVAGLRDEKVEGLREAKRRIDDGMDPMTLGKEDSSRDKNVSLVGCEIASEEVTGIVDNSTAPDESCAFSLSEKSTVSMVEKDGDSVIPEDYTPSRISLCSEAGVMSKAGSLDHLDLKDGQGVNSNAAVLSSEIGDTAAATCTRLSPSKSFPETLEPSCSDDFPFSFVAENRQNTNACGPSLEVVSDYREERVDFLGQMDVKLGNQISPSTGSAMSWKEKPADTLFPCEGRSEDRDMDVIGDPETFYYSSIEIPDYVIAFAEDDAELTEEKFIISRECDGQLDESAGSSLGKGASEFASQLTVAEPYLLQSCLPSLTYENRSLKLKNVPEISTGVIIPSSKVDNFEDGTDYRKCSTQSDHSSETRGPKIVSSSSQKSSRLSKSGRKTQAKRAARNSRNANKVACLLETREFVSEASKKKRTSLSKTARSSPWGALQNVSQLFEQVNGLGFRQMKSQRQSKARTGRESDKKMKNQQVENQNLSSGTRGSSTRIRLKVKLGKGPIQSSSNVIEVVSAPSVSIVANTGMTTSSKGTCAEVPKMDGDGEYKSRVEGCPGKSSSKEKLLSADPRLSSGLETENSDTGTVLERSTGNVREDCLGIPDCAAIETAGGTADGGYLDPETSPDSEVINLVPEAQDGEGFRGDIDEAVLHCAQEYAICEDVDGSKRGKKKIKVPRRGNHALKDGLSGSTHTLKDKSSKKRGGRQNLSDCHLSKEDFTVSTMVNASIECFSHSELLPSPVEAGFAVARASREVDNADRTFSEVDASLGLSESENTCGLNCSTKSSGRKLSQNAKSSRVYKRGSKSSNTSKSRKENQLSPLGKNKVKAEDIDNQALSQVKIPMEAVPLSIPGSGTMSGDPGEQHLLLRNAWVRCDDCYKWRRIPAALADSIEDTNSNWTCKDNMDVSFADCSIPQEKSNADINAELDISDASCEEDEGTAHPNYKELGLSRLTVPQKSSFVRIESNKFLHRSRRSQTIDEIMVCHCKPPSNGKLGCGDECLNRMLNIECVQGTCPCGDLCSNQQFQKRKYAKMQWLRCGKKGYGLQVLEDVSKGGFIIEYVGEVLDMPAYKARQREYASQGHKHFYFMTLNGSEVIDACAKGNLGRFINHSCDPNCRTEKWMVNGEICIGLFAIRDIKKGEEATFDYNYVRVFGAAAKKCVCGSPQCRGYIGGDPQNTEAIVQGDSDDEYPEPIMLYEDGGMVHPLNQLGGIITSGYESSMDQSAADIRKSRTSVDNGDPNTKVPTSDLPVDIIPQIKDDGSISVSATQQEIVAEEVRDASEKSEISSPSKPLSKLHDDDANRSRTKKFDTIDKRLHPLVKQSRSSGSIKKSKDSSSSINMDKVQGMAHKSQMVFSKHRKAVEGSSGGRFEAVEEKLNELLDSDGGISKRKDAPRGYLKLLFLTAASGDRGNEAIQSNRDLSMILDALLKTRSRVVLVDIISKNGLQMLHNIMKQYRRDFKKIPILRKLLKVLEYLAVREVLTLEHIASGPPCLGMESFRESILSLTEHDDKQVHQIARNFRDKWIPKHIRKFGFADRASASHNDWRDQGGRPTEAIDSFRQPILATATVVTVSQDSGRASCAEDSSVDGKRIRKRKSRWDQDAEPNTHPRFSQHEEQVCEEKKDCPGSVSLESSLGETVVADGRHQNSCEDVPPGFSSPPDTSRFSSNASSMVMDVSHENVYHLHCPFNVVAGNPQGKFISRLPVSYGIPLYFLQHLGKPQAESMESWIVAPGIPFHPFPPLPQLPRERKRQSPAQNVDSQNTGHSADTTQVDECSQASFIDDSSTGTSSSNLVDSEVACANSQQMFKRVKISSQDMGRRYFRQQKWNNTKVPPWLRKRNCWGYSVNNSKGGMCSIGLGNGVNGQKN